MRILIEGENETNYLAKCHEAFRTGLRRMFDTRMFGKGYDGYQDNLQSYQQILDRVFPDTQPDLLIASFDLNPTSQKFFPYDGIAKLKIPRAIILGDYWNFTEKHKDLYVSIIEKNEISMVLSYFPQPLEIFSDTSIADRLVYLPPAFDPQIYNDWQQQKIYDVGFLAAGTTEFTSFYPERYAIHQKLVAQNNFKYLYAAHPGWQSHSEDHPLVGKGFSKTINSCNLFVTTGGIYRNANAKYVEVLASASTLLADTPIGATEMQLKRGVNYIEVNEADILDAVSYFLVNPEKAQKIAQAGYETAMKYHTCYTRALEFYEAYCRRKN